MGFFSDLYRTLKEKSVSTLSASLAFYMMFTVFPGVIVIKAMIDVFYRDGGTDFVLAGLPAGTEALIRDYLLHTENFGNTGIIAGGVFLSVFSLVKFVRNLKRHIDEIYGAPTRRNYVFSWIFSFIMALYFLMLLYLSLFCLVFGESILKFLAKSLGGERGFVLIWQRVRFGAVVLLLFFFLVLVFRFLPDKKCSFKSVIPGVIFTETAWILASFLFSLYIENFTRYSVVYGSLGAVVIMMLWFYVLSNIILTGNCINLVFSLRKDS